MAPDENRLPRKLAAILYADVAGYSRLTGEDEEGTHRRLREFLDFMSGAIRQHTGRVVHYAGDAVLADFGTVTDSLECATRIQSELKKRNDELPADSRVEFRIGINLGEVIVDRDDIYGDGVNVAARLESLASPGGICISESVHTAIGNKLSLDYKDIGEQSVKNIAKPVRAYQVIDTQEAPTASSARTPELELPEKPSIAVLPFTNMGGDPEQTYFADGITDDIITDLSKVSGLFVIARNSTFAYKSSAVDVKQVARELGVRYVLEGSIRRAAGKVRINAQLIDATTASHLWAERYDGDMEDIFDLQDRITENIVAALAVTLTRAEQNRAMRKEPRSLDAYDYVLRGTAYHHRMTEEDNLKAQEMFGRAIEIDPGYAPGHAGLAWVLVHYANQGWSPDPEGTLQTALANAEKAVLLDDSMAKAHMVLGDVYCWMKQYEQAIAEGRRAIALDPSYADGHMALGYYLITGGHAEEGVQEALKALRFNPMHAHRIYYQVLSRGYYMLGQYEAAVAAAEQGVSRDPNHHAPHLVLTAALAQLEKMDDARRHAREVSRLNPSFSLRRFAEFVPFKLESDLEHYVAGLRKAGLPE